MSPRSAAENCAEAAGAGLPHANRRTDGPTKSGSRGCRWVSDRTPRSRLPGPESRVRLSGASTRDLGLKTQDPGYEHEAFIGLGSNLGDRRNQLRSALRSLIRRDVITDQVSALYETDPVGYADQPRFLNAVARVHTQLGPLQLLQALKAVEEELGRTPTFRDGPREIDLDLLLYDDLSYDTSELTIPHPRMHARAFVQIPLAELRDGKVEGAPGVERVEGRGWWEE